MPRFEVLATTAEVEGVKYSQGDEVTTDLELDVLFKNKYKRLDGKTKAPRDVDSRLDEGGGKQTDRPEAIRTTQARQGRTPDKDRTARRAPPPADVDEDDEEVLREDEEKEGEGEEGDEEGKTSRPKEGDEEGEGEGEGEGEEESQFGVDVTATQDEAADNKLKVFQDKRKRKFTVVSETRPGKPLHTETLKTKQDVKKFIREYSKKE